jgi:hypothetical protein
MGKKNRDEDKPAIRRGKRDSPAFTLLGTRFDTLNEGLVRQHISLLIATSIVMKFLIALVTIAVFQSFVDYFDITVYLNSATPLLQGQIPYIHYPFEYPVLMFIPIILAFIPAMLVQSATVFAFAFQFLMVVCDVLIVLCVYFIGLKIYHEKTAFYAGLIYATAFSTAYFVITKSDAFPTAILMLGLLFTVYGMNTRGYAGAAAGFFAKLFPAVALPFMVLFNAKKTSLKEELLSAGKIFLAFCIVLLLPLAVINPATISTYLFATGGTVGVYVNTATYTLYAYLHEVLSLGISTDTISAAMYGIMGLLLLLLVYVAYADREIREKTFLKFVLCAIFCLVFFTRFHSPQYIVWFTPLLALLVADDLVKIGLFYTSQVLAYIEFPLMFGSWYTNLEYMNLPGTPGWTMTLFFFTIEFIVLITLMYYAVRPREGIMVRLKKYLPGSQEKRVNDA